MTDDEIRTALLSIQDDPDVVLSAGEAIGLAQRGLVTWNWKSTYPTYHISQAGKNWLNGEKQ